MPKQLKVKFGIETRNMTPDDDYFLYYNPYGNDRERKWDEKEQTIAVEVQPFFDRMEFVGFKRGNKVTRALFVSTITKRGYAMNEHELGQGIKRGMFTGSQICGMFTFKARGGYATLSFVSHTIPNNAMNVPYERFKANDL